MECKSYRYFKKAPGEVPWMNIKLVRVSTTGKYELHENPGIMSWSLNRMFEATTRVANGTWVEVPAAEAKALMEAL